MKGGGIEERPYMEYIRTLSPMKVRRLMMVSWILSGEQNLRAALTSDDCCLAMLDLALPRFSSSIHHTIAGA